MKTLRWPNEFDVPFTIAEGEDVDEDAVQFFLRTHTMVASYKEAADELVELAMADVSKQQLLVFPILFSYRHYIELSLKQFIDDFGRTVGIEPNWRSHDLEVLWGLFLKIIDGFGFDPEADDQKHAGRIVMAFASVDPGSTHHRYPVNRNGQPVALKVSEIVLPFLKDVMAALDNYLNGTDAYLDAHRGGSSVA